MANFSTTSDLVNGALRRIGELTDGTSDFETDALLYVNSLHQAILSGGHEFDIDLGEPWTWGKNQTPGTLVLKPPYETGTVSLTNGSASGTFSDAPADSQLNTYLKIDDRPEFFRISAHTGGETAFTLDSEYTDDTNTATVFKAHRLVYPLTSGILRLIEPMIVYRSQSLAEAQEGKIYGIDSNALTREYPLVRLQRGTPDQFALIQETDGQISARFNRSVSEETKVEYEHIPIAADLTISPDTTPLVPREYRVALEYGATFFLMVDREDSRFQTYFDLTRAKLKAMTEADRKEVTNFANNKGELIPRQDKFSDRRGVLRTESGLIIG